MNPSHEPLCARAAGFTLLEVLVAVGIFALFSAMAYGSLLRILDTRDRLETEREYWRTVSLSLMQIEDDLAQARPRTVRGKMDWYGRPSLGNRSTAARSASQASEFTRGGQIVLGDGARSDMQRVGYQLREGTLSRLGLAGARPAGGQRTARRATARTCGGTACAFLRAARRPAWRWGIPGRHYPNRYSDPNNALPAAVELTLKLEGRGKSCACFR